MLKIVDPEKLMFEIGKHCYSFSTDFFQWENFKFGVMQALNTMPTVDTVRHAHWEQPSYSDEENGVFQCSNCKEAFVLISGSPKENKYEYCPNCGCKMDEKTEE